MKNTQFQRDETAQKQLFVFASDATGISCETLGLVVMSQFENNGNAEYETLPFIKTTQNATKFIKLIEQWSQDFKEVIVFSTFANKEVKDIFEKNLTVPYFDLFNIVLPVVSAKLNRKIVPKIETRNLDKKEERAKAIDYALEYDDGQRLDFDKADIILLGLSRSGKTPTSLWLALHYGLCAANYPITDDDFDKGKLPDSIIKNIEKCVLLVPSAERLNQIRQERYKNSKYASIENCQKELNNLEQLRYIDHIPRIDVSNKSIEEIAACALMHTNIHPKGRF